MTPPTSWKKLTIAVACGIIFSLSEYSVWMAITVFCIAKPTPAPARIWKPIIFELGVFISVSRKYQFRISGRNTEYIPTVKSNPDPMVVMRGPKTTKG